MEGLGEGNSEKIIKLLKEENDILQDKIQELQKDRDSFKDQLLLAHQMEEENESKMEEAAMTFEIEKLRLIEQSERKEYR